MLSSRTRFRYNWRIIHISISGPGLIETADKSTLKDFDLIQWGDAISRFHPVLLHLPIGLIIALVWLQLWQKFVKGAPTENANRGPLVYLLALSTPVAASTGWLLHESASYPDPVGLHEGFGIGLACLTLLVAWTHFKRSKLHEPLVWLAFLILIPTAHFGGTLTHGDGFLTEAWLEESPEEATEVPNEPVEAGEAAASPRPMSYADVRPIFEDLCFRCHGERKQRGGLALNTEELALKGGDSGPAFVPGSAEKSLLWEHLTLPLDHDDHMPPSNKSQPDADELKAIETWLEGE